MNVAYIISIHAALAENTRAVWDSRDRTSSTVVCFCILLKLSQKWRERSHGDAWLRIHWYLRSYACMNVVQLPPKSLWGTWVSWSLTKCDSLAPGALLTLVSPGASTDGIILFSSTKSDRLFLFIVLSKARSSPPPSHVACPVFLVNSAHKKIKFHSGVTPWRVSPGRAYYVRGKEAYCLHFEPGGQISMFQGGDGNGMITQYIWDVVFSWL